MVNPSLDVGKTLVSREHVAFGNEGVEIHFVFVESEALEVVPVAKHDALVPTDVGVRVLAEELTNVDLALEDYGGVGVF